MVDVDRLARVLEADAGTVHALAGAEGVRLLLRDADADYPTWSLTPAILVGQEETDGDHVARPRLATPALGPPAGGTLTPDEVLALHDELRAYHREFAPLFHRSAQRHWALKYLEGQLLPLERKSIAPMADALDGGNVQAMQQFIGLGAGDDDAVLARHQRLVAETLGDAVTGALIVDGCDFPKQGDHSVGVAR